MRLTEKTLAAGLLALLGAGCAAAPPSPAPAPAQKPAEAAAPMPAWQALAGGAGRFDCPRSACGVHLVMYRFAAGKYGLHIDNDPSGPLTIEGWAKKEGQPALVANGVFFDEKFQPTGMLVSDAIPANSRSYDLDKSAFVDLFPLRIADTASEPLAVKGQPLSEGAQSFPLLIKDGQAIGSFKDQHASRRTFIGIDRAGDAIIGAVPEDAVTFADLVKLLARTGTEWSRVLNLDGGTSTGIAANVGGWSESFNSIVQVPNVIVVTKL